MKIDKCPQCGGVYEEDSATCPYCKTFNKERDEYLREQHRRDEKSSAIAKICLYGFVITTIVSIGAKVIFSLVMVITGVGK